jgi:hypothetical protein
MSSQINYTLTHMSEHHDEFSHDALNRYLRDDKLTPRLVWENVRGQLELSPTGYLVFDDTVLDKRHSAHIKLVRRQYSGNAHAVIKGIGVVNCLYVNPDSCHYWVVDWRIFDPEGDGKSKLEHVCEMLLSAAADKQLTFSAVLMDMWYATKELLMLIEELGQRFICPIKANRLVDDSDGQRVDELSWSEQEQRQGKRIKIKSFPKGHRVKLFRLVVSTHRTDWIVTNDPTRNSTDAVQQACSMCWKIEQLHRELKQLTKIEKCQCRKAKIQRNHTACAMLVWVRLKHLAQRLAKTVYQLKHWLLSDYLRPQLRRPSLSI